MGSVEIINAPEKGAPKKGADDARCPQKVVDSLVNRIQFTTEVPRIMKVLIAMSPYFKMFSSTCETAYPTMETVPKFRQSARWKLCWL